MEPGESERDEGFDFPGFLAIWLYRMRMPERDFWKTMTPRRLLATMGQPERAPQRKAPQMSLSEYLSGGT